MSQNFPATRQEGAGRPCIDIPFDTLYQKQTF